MKVVGSIVSALVAASIFLGGAAHAVSVGQPCGGAESRVCDKGLWCEPPIGKCSSEAGVCVTVPRLCFARKGSRGFKPVCGCNSKTYSSDCFRRAYKIGKSHDGKCEAISATRSSGR